MAPPLARMTSSDEAAWSLWNCDSVTQPAAGDTSAKATKRCTQEDILEMRFATLLLVS